MTKLSVIVHENDEVTVKDERGLPVLCKDCRFGGWLTKWEFRHHKYPVTCLFHSGGSHPVQAVRIRIVNTDFDVEWRHDNFAEHWRDDYPFCAMKNGDGNCKDFIRAKSQSWWERMFHRRRMRE